ncbi:MAG: hypothetical protein EPO11_06345 [Gammaproteobacteria bacterium]|nr:MAG: hypothetical protein EPO11_06345 [Gammaproteobacteria bacterium]
MNTYFKEIIEEINNKKIGKLHMLTIEDIYNKIKGTQSNTKAAQKLKVHENKLINYLEENYKISIKDLREMTEGQMKAQFENYNLISKQFRVWVDPTVTPPQQDNWFYIFDTNKMKTRKMVEEHGWVQREIQIWFSPEKKVTVNFLNKVPQTEETEEPIIPGDVQPVDSDIVEKLFPRIFDTWCGTFSPLHQSSLGKRKIEEEMLEPTPSFNFN